MQRRAGAEDPTSWDPRMAWLSLPVRPSSSGSPAGPGDPMSTTLELTVL